MAASQSDDGVGASDGPKHPRLFEPRTDYGLAAGFDDTGANKQVLATILGITHALRVPFEVIRLGANLLDHVSILGTERAKRQYQLFDFSLIEEATLVDLDPGFLVHFVIGMQLAS